MLSVEEETLIKMNLDLFNLHDEKEKKFLEIWNAAKLTMEEKLKYQKSLSEILMRCCSFLTFLSFSNEDGEELKANQMEKFMKVENSKILEHNGNSSLLFELANLKNNQSRLLNLHEFFKYLKKIVGQNYESDSDFQLSRDIIQDFSFSDTLYKKCEEFMNLFFDNHSPYFQNIKKLIWTCYIYSRAKLINHSRNLLECLPLLISVISMFLMDIEDQRFTHSFYTMIDDEVKFILSKTNTDTVSTTSYQTLFREKKKEIITSILYKKAGQRIDTISQINQLVLKELKEMSELNKYFLNISNGCIDNCARYFDLADENVISSMISIFYAHYERFLKFKNFDERIFLMEKTNSDCSPVKLTPFKRQKILSQDFNMKRPTSFKTLDFDSLKNPSMIIKAGGINHLENEQMNLINKPISHNFNNFAMNLDAQQRNSTNSFRGLDVKELAQKLNNNNVEMTPCSRVMFMDRWVKEYIKDWNVDKLIRLENLCNASFDNVIQIDVNSFICEHIEKVQKLFNMYKVRVLTHMEEIKLLTFKIISGLIKRDERKFKAEFISRILSNPNFLKSALIVGVEIVLFIENVEEISFFKLADVFELDIYEFWKIINPFLNFDLTIPSDIRLHFNEIELQLMSFMIWKKASKNFKDELNEFLREYSYFMQDKELKEIEDIEFNNQSLFVYQDHSIFSKDNIVDLMSPSTTTENSSTSLNHSNSTNLTSYKHIKPVYILLRRILNYSIFLNKKITDNLRLNKETAKECENLLKKIMNNKNYIEIFFNRHIDQIIVCAIIAIMKVRNLFDEKDGIKTILAAYHKSKPDDSESTTKSLFYDIKLYTLNPVTNTLNSVNPSHRTMNISQFYEEIFTKKLETLIQQVKEEEDDDYTASARKKRKLSVPDSEIRKFQFEDETAFENNTIMYEPLSKTIFSKQIGNRIIGMGKNLRESPNIKHGYLSLRCSPMLGMYQSPTVNRTPRTLRVKDAYNDYPACGEVISLTNNSASNVYSSGNNQYKNNLKRMLSGSKLNNLGVLKHPISDLNSAEKNLLMENSSVSNSMVSEVNDFNIGLNFTLSNSQSTPEFNKTSKNN